MGGLRGLPCPTCLQHNRTIICGTLGGTTPVSGGVFLRPNPLSFAFTTFLHHSANTFVIQQVAPFFLDSCEGAGIRLTEDFNKPGGREGAGYYHFAVRDGVRDSAARAMLGDIVMGRDVRTNLDIVTGAHVSKVLIEDAQPVRRRTVLSKANLPGHGRNAPSHLAGKLSSRFCRPS